MNEIEFENKLVGLKTKYQVQFKKIYESNEDFKGDFNIMAFLFGVIWCLSKGLWVVSIVAIVVSILSSGIGAIFFWLYFGFRGNYIYYKYHVEGKQVVF